MLQTIKIFLATSLAFFFLDLSWLAYFAKDIYFNELGSLLKRSGTTLTPSWSAALGVYLLFSLGIVLFVLPKAHGSYVLALAWGAIFGLVVYGVYDLTNYAILANWTLKITIIDCLWGMFICSLISCFSTALQKYL